MKYIFSEDNFGYELAAMAALVEHKPETIVGCVLISGDPKLDVQDPFRGLELFGDKGKLNTLIMYTKISHGSLVNLLYVGLIVKKPNSVLDLQAWVSASVTLDFGKGKVEDLPIIRFLELLEKQNIRFYISQGTLWTGRVAPTQEESEERMKPLIREAFSYKMGEWLPKSWGLPASTWIMEKA
jgi:hypothetical protein